MDTFILLDRKLIKLNIAAFIHAHMCACNYIFGYKGAERVFLLCFNPTLVCYRPFCEFTFRVQYNLVRCLWQYNTFFYVGIFSSVK